MKLKLGDITKIRTGKLDANAASEDGFYPFFTCSREPLKISTYSYECECVLVAGNGDLNVKYYNGKFDAYQRTYIIEAKKPDILYMPYLYYFMEKYVVELRKLAIGGVIKYIKLGNLTDALIELPTYEQQRILVERLEKVKSAIDKRNAQLSKLDELVKCRFVELFGLPSTTSHPSTVLRDVATIKHGYAFKGKYFSKVCNDIVLVTPGNFKVGGGFQEHECRYFTGDYPDEFVLEPGSLIVTMTDLSKNADTLGYAALIPEHSERVYLHNQRIGLINLKPCMNKYFVCYYMQTEEYRINIVSTATGSTVHHTSPTRILDSAIMLPPLSLQKEFENFVRRIDKLRIIGKRGRQKA